MAVDHWRIKVDFYVFIAKTPKPKTIRYVSDKKDDKEQKQEDDKEKKQEDDKEKKQEDDKEKKITDATRNTQMKTPDSKALKQNLIGTSPKTLVKKTKKILTKIIFKKNN